LTDLIARTGLADTILGLDQLVAQAQVVPLDVVVFREPPDGATK